MSPSLLAAANLDPNQKPLFPGDAGWGDALFVTIWALSTLLLAAYYCYRSFFSR